MLEIWSQISRWTSQAPLWGTVLVMSWTQTLCRCPITTVTSAVCEHIVFITWRVLWSACCCGSLLQSLQGRTSTAQLETDAQGAHCSLQGDKTSGSLSTEKKQCYKYWTGQKKTYGRCRSREITGSPLTPQEAKELWRQKACYKIVRIIMYKWLLLIQTKKTLLYNVHQHFGFLSSPSHIIKPSPINHCFNWRRSIKSDSLCLTAAWRVNNMHMYNNKNTHITNRCAEIYSSGPLSLCSLYKWNVLIHHV